LVGVLGASTTRTTSPGKEGKRSATAHKCPFIRRQSAFQASFVTMDIRQGSPHHLHLQTVLVVAQRRIYALAQGRVFAFTASMIHQGLHVIQERQAPQALISGQLLHFRQGLAQPLREGGAFGLARLEQASTCPK